MNRGQAIAEFALVLPVMLVVMLGFAELAFIFAARQGYQNSAEVMVQWAASEMGEKPDAEDWHAGWEDVVEDETQRAECDSQGTKLTFPDETHLPGDRVVLTLTCTYLPKLSTWTDFDWDGVDVVVHSGAVVPGSLPPPSLSPSPSATQ